LEPRLEVGDKVVGKSEHGEPFNTKTVCQVIGARNGEIDIRLLKTIDGHVFDTECGNIGHTWSSMPTKDFQLYKEEPMIKCDSIDCANFKRGECGLSEVMVRRTGLTDVTGQYTPFSECTSYRKRNDDKERLALTEKRLAELQDDIRGADVQISKLLFEVREQISKCEEG